MSDVGVCEKAGYQLATSTRASTTSADVDRRKSEGSAEGRQGQRSERTDDRNSGGAPCTHTPEACTPISARARISSPHHLCCLLPRTFHRLSLLWVSRWSRPRMHQLANRVRSIGSSISCVRRLLLVSCDPRVAILILAALESQRSLSSDHHLSSESDLLANSPSTSRPLAPFCTCRRSTTSREARRRARTRTNPIARQQSPASHGDPVLAEDLSLTNTRTPFSHRLWEGIGTPRLQQRTGSHQLTRRSLHRHVGPSKPFFSYFGCGAGRKS